jgi:sugar phosphate isomerase/epimerase
MLYTRRDLGKLALASLPLAGVLKAAKVDSVFDGMQFGIITYSFNRIASPDPEAIIKACVDIGLGEVELMSNHCETLAGAPSAGGRGGFGGGRGQGRGGGRAPLTPEQQAAQAEAQKRLTDWRAAATPATWKAVTKKFNDAGVEDGLLCYNMRDSMTDDDIEYGFRMAEGLGAKAISTSTTLTMAKRIAPIADKHKLMVGYHGHDATNDPNQTATLESYDTLMAYGKYNGINLDIGHFTAANYDAVDFIQKHHDKITNLHLKDMKRDHGNYTLFGQGDVPMKAVLQLLKKGQYGFPANIEWEPSLPIPADSSLVGEIKKALAYCKGCLA